MRLHLLRLGDHPGGVQECLGRDAADVQADTAELLVALDQDGVQFEVRGTERRAVAADARPDHDHLGVVAAVGRRGRERRLRGDRRRGAG